MLVFSPTREYTILRLSHTITHSMRYRCMTKVVHWVSLHIHRPVFLEIVCHSKNKCQNIIDNILRTVAITIY